MRTRPRQEYASVACSMDLEKNFAGDVVVVVSEAL
jgi:hypothetical protein